MIELDEAEFRRWLESAKRTLASAQRDAEAGDYNWACFKAHQAGEKALKALLWGVGRPRTGHMLPKLLEALCEAGINVPREVRDAAILLNKYYIPTRYPDAWTEGIPEEYFGEIDARIAINAARRIIAWVERVWSELLKRGGERGRER